MTSTELLEKLCGDSARDTQTLTALLLAEQDRDAKRLILEFLGRINDYAHLAESGVRMSKTCYRDYVAGNMPDKKPDAALLEAFAEELHKAEAGSAEAQYIVAMHYLHGSFGLPDYAEAVSWLTRAAEQGESRALYELGVCRMNGEGVPLDYHAALDCFTRAAEAGNTDAMLALALVYRGGRGIAADPEKTFYWYTRAAEAGNSYAFLNLGICTFNGSGTEANIERAIAYVERAESMGNADAKMLLKRMKRYYEEADLDAEECAARNRTEIPD